MCVVAGAVAGGVASAATGAALSGGGGGGGAQQAASAADPFAGQRGQYQDMLSQLIKNPSSVTSTPGYEFQLQQGLNAVQGSAAAGGMLNSGNTLAALTKYGEDYASTQYNNQALLLAQLAGANVGSPGTAGQILNSQNLLNQQSASALGNTVGGAVNQGLQNWFSPSYQGGNPFSTSPGYGVGGNTYGFQSGVTDPSYGVAYPFGA